MNILPMHNVNFKGLIKLYSDTDRNSDKTETLDTNNIKEINNKIDGTEIVYKEFANLKKVERLTVPYNIQEILNAYNAAKNSDLKVDMTY